MDGKVVTDINFQFQGRMHQIMDVKESHCPSRKVMFAVYMRGVELAGNDG